MDKSEIKKNLDKIIKIRFKNLPKIKLENETAVHNYALVLKEILKCKPTSYLPSNANECDAYLLMISSVNDGGSTYRYENTFKFLCDTNHPLLNELWKCLHVIPEKVQEIINLSKNFTADRLEAFFLFKDDKNYRNLNVFKSNSIIELIDKLAEDSKHGTVVSHPAKMSNPNSKFPRINADNTMHSSDGFVRSGNIDVDFDFHINAAQLKVYKFLSLRISGVAVLEILRNKDAETLANTFCVETQKAEQWLEKFQLCFSSQAFNTSFLIKQVYFPVEDSEYHQLSILTASGIVFKLKNKIDHLNRYSPQSYLGKKAKKNGSYLNGTYSSLSNLTEIKHGGDHPKNISALNNKYQTYYLLNSSPPQLKPRNIRLPKSDFFKDSLNPWDAKEIMEKLHKLLLLDINNKSIRDGRDYHIQAYVDLIIEKMWQMRAFLADFKGDLSSQVLSAQKIWLYPENNENRQGNSEWLDTVIRQLSQSLIRTYTKVVAKPIKLADEELLAIEKIVEQSRETLR